MNIPYVMRKCSKCKEWKVANNVNFSKKKSGKWGLERQCKKCRNIYHKEHYNNNKDKKKLYYENNKEYIKERERVQKKEYYKKNKIKIDEYNKKYYEDNKEERLEYGRLWRENNKEYIRKYQNEYVKNNPEKMFNKSNKRRNKLNNQGRGITKEQWKEMMNFFDWKCAYSGEKMESNKTTNGRTIDHIVALDSNGENEIWNCVPMKRGYNTSKSTKNMLEWYLQQEYFDINRLTKIYEWRIYAYEKWGRNKW